MSVQDISKNMLLFTPVQVIYDILQGSPQWVDTHLTTDDSCYQLHIMDYTNFMQSVRTKNSPQLTALDLQRTK